MGKRLALLVAVFSVLFTQSVFSQSLLGSKESLQKQNNIANTLGLFRVSNHDELEGLKSDGALVPIPLSVLVDKRIPEEFRFVRRETALYLDDLGVRFINTFGRRFQVNSAVRTLEYQIELKKGGNNNAAPTEGDRASTHPTGATIDIGKIGLSNDELNWLRAELLKFEEESLVEATEEWSQLVFHVMVFGWYTYTARQ